MLPEDLVHLKKTIQELQQAMVNEPVKSSIWEISYDITLKLKGILYEYGHLYGLIKDEIDGE